MSKVTGQRQFSTSNNPVWDQKYNALYSLENTLKANLPEKEYEEVRKILYGRDTSGL